MEQNILPDRETVPKMLEILDRGEQCLLTVTGSSMTPFLHHKKDAVLLKRPEPADLTRGRILFFCRQGDTYILHRVRKAEKDGRLRMNGDAQPWVELIRPEQVLAVVTAVVGPNGRIKSCGSLSWRFWSALWYPTRPIRRQLVPFLGRIHRVFRKMIGKIR